MGKVRREEQLGEGGRGGGRGGGGGGGGLMPLLYSPFSRVNSCLSHHINTLFDTMRYIEARTNATVYIHIAVKARWRICLHKLWLDARNTLETPL